jgi:two-component system, NtrC family, response regulator HydG
MLGPDVMTESDDATTTSSDRRGAGNELAEPVVTVLVIAWARQEPRRAGELAVIPPHGGMLVLGRGASEGEPRLNFLRPRPGRLEPAASLSARALSRRQVELVPRGDVVDVRRVGRCPMRINGTECDAGRLEPGDTLALGQELVLLCARRPACPPPLRYLGADDVGRLGELDRMGILGEAPATWRLREEIAFAAKSDRHVLIVGESGTGKELAALAVRGLSARENSAFVARNAATLPPTLLDAELFGNQRNYPNPGMAERPGLIGQADGGTLFLDEIGELPLDLQSHLLRVLDAGGEYQRLGEPTLRRSDFRLLAATNQDPSALRPDFLARLVVRVEVPPLSERRQDIPLLARHLLLRASKASSELVGRFLETHADGFVDVRMDAKLVEALLRHDFEMNARTLEALLWKVIASSPGDTLMFTPSVFAREAAPAPVPENQANGPRFRNPEPGEPEIREALRNAGGNVSLAAKALGLSSRYALYRLLVKLGIEPGAAP